MARLNSPNNATSTLAAAINASQDNLTVAAGHGARFGTAPFVITIDSEVMRVGARSGDSFTQVSRAYEPVAGVQASASHSLGAEVKANPTGRQLSNIYDSIGKSLHAVHISEISRANTAIADMITLVTNLPDDVGFWIYGLARKGTGAAAVARLGLGLNTTNYDPATGSLTQVALWASDGVDRVEDGAFQVWVPPRRGNYLRAHIGMYHVYLADGIYTAQFSFPITAAMPTGAITSIRIRGSTGNAAVSVFVRDVQVYASVA